MEVILLEDIKKLGKLGENVRVKPGHGRNFLIPQGKALIANAANKAYFEARRAELEKEMQQRLVAANERLAAIGQLALSISARASDEGRLFGSITAQDIVDAIQAQTGVAVTKHEIRLAQGPLRQIGEHTVGLHLHNEVATEIMVTIVPE